MSTIATVRAGDHTIPLLYDHCGSSDFARHQVQAAALPLFKEEREAVNANRKLVPKAYEKTCWDTCWDMKMSFLSAGDRVRPPKWIKDECIHDSLVDEQYLYALAPRCNYPCKILPDIGQQHLRVSFEKRARGLIARKDITLRFIGMDQRAEARRFCQEGKHYCGNTREDGG